jgi:hypothetical protein
MRLSAYAQFRIPSHQNYLDSMNHYNSIQSGLFHSINSKTIFLGLLSFIIVLLFMPLGHALMVLNEVVLHDAQFYGAGIIGILGFVLLLIGIRIKATQTVLTLLGLLAGILVWTGWIEFSFVWVAHKLNVLPLMDGEQIATKPEYLLMPSSLGILGALMLYFVFSQTNCQWFVGIQNLLHTRKQISNQTKPKKPTALVTFIETIMIIWTFYIVLLLVYDTDIAGDRHPITYVVAFGSLAWSGYLITNLIKISRFDYSIRYAVPTVIIFWNFIEILGRWNLFKEIWIHPFDYKLELLLTTMILVSLIGFLIYHARHGKLKWK